MKFSAVISTLAFFSASALAEKITFDTIYDTGSNSLNNVACSDGANGLVTKGFTTFDSLPSFPFIGGANAVKAWNSTNCGTCWSITYNGTTINLLAVDTAGVGFNIAKKAMDVLTKNKTDQLGVIDAVTAQVDKSACGL